MTVYNYFDSLFIDNLLLGDMKILKYLNNTSENDKMNWHVTTFSNQPEASIKRLKANDLLNDSNLINVSNMTLPELKSILKENGFKVSGKREDVLNRVIENIDIDKLNIVKRKLYITVKGYTYLELFRERLEQDRLSIFKKLFELCKSNKIEEFYKEICKYKLSMFDSPGINTDWEKYLKNGIPLIEKNIITNISDDIPEDIRVCTITAYLAGLSIFSVSSLYQKIYDINMEDMTTAMHNLHSTISNLREVAEYRQCGIKKYTFICACDDRTCPLCERMNNKTFLVNDAVSGVNLPPLHNGCRCTTVAKK